MIKDTRIVNDAVFLIDDNHASGIPWLGKVQSGWDIDYRSEPKHEGFALCTDENSEYDVWMRRKIVPQNHGKVCYAQSLIVNCGTNFYIRFGTEENTAFELTSIDGFFAVNGVKLPITAELKRNYHFEAELDLDKKTAKIYFDEMSYGTVSLNGGSLEILKIGAKKRTNSSITPGYCRVWINYLLVDKCYCNIPGRISDKWNVKSEGKSYVTKIAGSERSGKFITYTAVTEDSEAVKISRNFDKACGNVVFELKYHSENDGIKALFSLTSDGKDIVTFFDNGNALYCGDVLLREHHVNVWQTFYIEADVNKGEAKIMLNGKKCGKFAFEKVQFADGIKIEYAKDLGGAFEFSDILVYVKQPELYDYVPEPVLPKKKDYVVGMNVCSLWRNGFEHWGWDTISPYDENKTYLGYYDEGLPEVSDWEIKWLAEHGVDFELYCWYNSEANAPIKKTGLSSALHDGHFKAKYGDMMKFAIIWEAANCAHAGVEGFRNHVVPYWMDYFFSDDRYVTLDNKVLVSVFGSEQLIKDFGSPEAVKEQLDYVRNEVKKLGYDGAVFMSCSAPTESVKACGFDAVYAYHWGPQGYSPEYTKSRITSQIEKGLLHVIPTVSSGFNSIGWNGKRTPLLSTDGMRELFRWIKEDVLSENKGEDWKKKFVMLSTWNEYGEGTYMCPSGLNGFGYLDEVRKAFTEETQAHTNVKPNEKQLDRLGYLYPKGRRWVKCQQYVPKECPDDEIGTISVSSDDWTPENLTEYYTDENGRLCGKGVVHDPKLIYSKPLEIDCDKVLNIKIKMSASTPAGFGTEAKIYYMTENDKGWSEAKSKFVFTSGNELKDYNFYVAESKEWNGKITGLRFDPIVDAGTFEIESITLCTDTKKYEIWLNGEKYFTSVPIMKKESGIYIPYEQNKSYDGLKFYHEWYYDEKTLYLVHGDKHMYFTEGKDYVTVNGEEIKLHEPLFRFDSVPMLPLDILCEICGDINYEIDGRFIRING